MSQFATPEWDKKFRNILADIGQSKCVVLLGPELIRTGNKTLHAALRDHLASTNDDDIAHYYERDGFFLFRSENDDTAKKDVQREVVSFYKNLLLGKDVDETLLLRLARLRVPVILSINPDAFLSDIAFKYGIKHRFSYFQHGGTAVQDVETPTADMPLFYNLCGSLDRDDSLVLDFDDLFSLLSALLGSPGLPSNLALTLRQARHFLFVGFDFDKWYSQLLLRVLSGKRSGIRSLAIDTARKDHNTTIFLYKQFRIEFINDETEFLSELVHRAETGGLMRDIVEAQTPEAVRIIRFLQNGDILGALHQMKNDIRIQQEATLLLARFHDLKDREARRTMDSRDYFVEYNRIVDAILETGKCL